MEAARGIAERGPTMSALVILLHGNVRREGRSVITVITILRQGARRAWRSELKESIAEEIVSHRKAMSRVSQWGEGKRRARGWREGKRRLNRGGRGYCLPCSHPQQERPRQGERDLDLRGPAKATEK